MKQPLRLKLKPSPRQKIKLYQAGVVATFGIVIATIAILYQMVSMPDKASAMSNSETKKSIEGFYNRIELSIGCTSGNISGTHFNFPFLFDKQLPEFCTDKYNGFIQTSDASDVVFTKEDGVSIIPHSIERYIPAKGRIIAWLNLDTLVANQPKKICIYYGSKLKKAEISEVFPKSYTHVYHLNGDFENSLQTPQSQIITSVTDEQGIIAGAKSWNASQVSESCLKSNSEDYYNFTYSAWVYPHHITTDQIVASARNEKSGFRLLIDKKGQLSGELVDLDGNSAICKKSNLKTILPNQWNHIVFSFQSQTGSLSLYLNGELVSNTVLKLSKIRLSDICIGSDAFKLSPSFSGIIDECRLAKVPFTIDRIRMEYLNQLHPAKCFMLDKSNETPAELADLVSFDTDVKSSHVVLNWSTREENKLDYFIIEKSVDGQQFSKVDVKFASGYANQTIKNYFIIDPKPYEGYSYYRLKMMGKGGQMAESHIIHVSFQPKTGGFDVQAIEPNPFNKNFKVTLLSHATHEVDVKLTSVSGQLILQDKLKMNPGQAADFSFEDKFNLRPGLYFLNFSQNNESQTLRLVKQQP